MKFTDPEVITDEVEERIEVMEDCPFCGIALSMTDAGKTCETCGVMTEILKPIPTSERFPQVSVAGPVKLVNWGWSSVDHHPPQNSPAVAAPASPQAGSSAASPGASSSKTRR